MAIYRDRYQLSKALCVNSFFKNLIANTGLEIELEKINDTSFFIHCSAFKMTIEVSIESDNFVSIFFPPKKKGYLEFSLLKVLSEYTSQKMVVPDYVNKSWNKFKFYEKFFIK